MSTNALVQDSNILESGAVVTLFELDLRTGVASVPTDTEVFRWHSGGNDSMEGVVWQGYNYSPFPVEASGFEMSGNAQIPRPKLLVSNITSILTSLINTYEDLVGAKVTRKKTFERFLDSYCVIEGSSSGVYTSNTCSTAGGTWYENPEADPTAHFADEIWYIDRKSLETGTHVEFELTAAYDVQGVKLPARHVISDTCLWVYKEGACDYTGSSYWDINNISVTNVSEDVCGKTFGSCELRFPDNSSTSNPFGGFPGAGKGME